MTHTQFPTQGAPLPQPPWHMWGTSEQLSVEIPAGPGVATMPTLHRQLARVSYRRPETWSFFVAGELVDGVAPDQNMTLIAQVALMCGVGRDHYDTSPLGQAVPGANQTWIEFVWFVPGPGGVTPQNLATRKKWTTSAPTPPLDDTVAGSGQIMTSFPAQDIQIQAQFAMTLAAPGAILNRATVKLTCFLAPLSHVRPDWLRIEGPEQSQFLGAETGGI